jgi:hypothetical protein
MATEQDQGVSGGLSRRQLLTRGAVAGGLIWAAPVIRTTAAYATTANGTERPCTNFFMVMIKPDGSVHDAPGNLHAKTIPPAIQQWFTDNPGVTVAFPDRTQWPLLTQTSQDAWAILLSEVTGPNAAGRQCRMVLGWARKDKNFKEGYVDPNPPLAVEVGRRLLFPCPDPGHSGGGGDGGDGDDDNHGGGGDGDSDDGGGGGNNGGGGDHNGDDGGCKEGHDDGDHDKDDVACDAGATDSAAGTTGVGTADTKVSATANSGQISSDGVSSGSSISSDGGPSHSVSSDGSPSSGGSSSAHDCIDEVYLIFCCPR